MSGKHLKFEEAKPLMILTSSDFKRVFVLCDLFYKHEIVTQALGGEEHVVLKENNKEAIRVNMEVFKTQLSTGKILLLN